MMGPIGHWKFVNTVYNESHAYLIFLIPFLILDLILRGLSLWKSARKNQGIWFVALLVVNSMGILPLIYLVLNRDPKIASKRSSKTK